MKRKSLEATLEELEQADSKVDKAAKLADWTIWRLGFRERINERRRAEGKEPLR